MAAMTSVTEYTMREARDMIEDAILYPLPMDQNRAIYLEGDPGLGKTAMAHMMYQKYRRYTDDAIKQEVYWRTEDGVISLIRVSDKAFKEVDNVHSPGGFTHFIAFVAPEREPTDFGLPVPNAERDAINMLPLSDFKFAPTDRPFIVFDEIDKAHNMMQNVIGRIMHERRFGNVILTEGTVITAAGNKMTNRAGGFAANTHIKNRRTHVPVRVSHEEWLEDVAIPFDLHSSVVSYIRVAPDMLHKFDSGAPAFPSPRSVTKVGLMLNGEKKPHVERAFIEGDCGVEWANTFWGHLKIYRSLRSPEVIIANPTKVPLPTGKESAAVMWAEITGLARYANERNADAIFKYFNRIPEEFAFVGYRDVLQRAKPLIMRSDSAQLWAVKNASLIQTTSLKASSK